MKVRVWLGAGAVVLLGAAGPCGSVPIKDGLGELGRTQVSVNDVKELKGAQQELAKCDALRTQEVVFDEERAIGQAAAMNIAEQGGLVIGKTVSEAANVPTEYLNRVGLYLALRSERPELPWSFGILADDSINAFSTPGGYVLVTRGLLKHVKNEAQLAGVLAHEIAHVADRHALNYYREVKTTACRNGMVAEAGGKVAGATGAVAHSLNADVGFVDFNKAPEALNALAKDFTLALTTRKYPDAQEKQADRDGVALMIAGGYQPEQYAAFLESLPEDFQPKTHPPKAARTASVRDAVKGFGNESVDPLRAGGAPFGEEQGFRAPPLGKELASLK